MKIICLFAKNYDFVTAHGLPAGDLTPGSKRSTVGGGLRYFITLSRIPNVVNAKMSTRTYAKPKLEGIIRCGGCREPLHIVLCTLFILLTRRKATKALYIGSNFLDLLSEIPRYCCPVILFIF